MQGVLSNRSVLNIAGEDARAFLQGLVTQDVLHVTPGQGVFSALLTPQGKILFDFFLAPHAEGFFMDCRQSAAPALQKRLMMYKLRAKATITIEDDLAVMVGVGACAGCVTSFPDPRLSGLPHRTIMKKADARPADADYDALRISLGVPEFGADFDSEEVFALDVNYDALSAVSYKKGCFVGQEVTSRMKRKGEVRKRTLIAAFDGPHPSKGAAAVAGDAQIGEILSGCGDAALALVRTDRLNEARQAGIEPSIDGRKVRFSFPAYLERL